MGTIGGKVDCITLRDGLVESGGEGRNIRSGMLRNLLDGPGRRVLWMRWYLEKSSALESQ